MTFSNLKAYELVNDCGVLYNLNMLFLLERLMGKRETTYQTYQYGTHEEDFLDKFIHEFNFKTAQKKYTSQEMRLDTLYLFLETEKENMSTSYGIAELNLKKDKSSGVSFITNDFELLQKVSKFLGQHLKSKIVSSQNSIYAPMMTKTGLKFQEVGKGGKVLVRENYNQETINSFDYVVSQFNSNEPDGRLLILQGQPGTGKSYFIRGLVEHIKNSIFIVVSPEQVNHLMDPSFIPALLNLKDEIDTPSWDNDLEEYITFSGNITLVVEDADSILLPRDSSNMTAISTLLNFADGIVGESLDVRIICSTNAKLTRFDEALTRPGRLLKVLDIGTLCRNQAVEVYNRLTNSELGSEKINSEMTLAQVYHLAKGYNPEVKKEKVRIGF